MSSNRISKEDLKFDDLCPGDHMHAWHALMHALDGLDSLTAAANCLRCGTSNTERAAVQLTKQLAIAA